MSDLRECPNIIPLFLSQTTEVDYHFSVWWYVTHARVVIHTSQNKNIISIARYSHQSVILSLTQLTKAPLLFVLSSPSRIIFQTVIEPYPLLHTPHPNEHAHYSCICSFDLFYLVFISWSTARLKQDAVIKWKVFLPRHWPSCEEFIGHRRIPLTITWIWYFFSNLNSNSKELYCHKKHCILHTDTRYGTQQFYQVKHH